MRTAGEIKKELIFLRFDKTKRLPLVKIAKDSRCSPVQVMDAMRMIASETIQRRLDAYLDAKDLHVKSKDTMRLRKIENLTRELWNEYEARSLPVKDVMLLSPARQERLLIAMEWRAKRLLREKFHKETGVEIHFSDGLNYWRCKTQAATRQGKLSENRNNHYRYGPRPVV